MARRSSARLANRRSTPKRVSLSHDAVSLSHDAVSLSHDAAVTRTPRTVPTKLASLQESDEMAGALPDPPSMVSEPDLKASRPRQMPPETPAKKIGIEPSEHEMHPQLHHPTTAKPREEARHLAFTSIAPHTEPPQKAGAPSGLQATLSGMRSLASDLQSPSFRFTFHRERSLELSPEAKQLMDEQREKAALIREQMISRGDGVQSVDQVMAARRIAKPKGRFSNAHLKQFEKMDSIAGHASAFRADPSRLKLASEKEETTSLKRSPSKARLDEDDGAPSSRPSSREGRKPTPAFFKASGLPRSASAKDLTKAAPPAPSSPIKRVKRTESDDVSVTRPHSSDGDCSLPATPRQLLAKANAPNLASFTTPTQASLARGASVRSVKDSKIPGPQLTPAKSLAAAAAKLPPAPQFTPAKTAAHAGPKPSAPLLAKSPSKASLSAIKPTATAAVEKPSSMMSAALARSPVKGGVSHSANAQQQDAEAAPEEDAVPFFSRSPVKAPAAQPTEGSTSTPFLARSPTKLPIASNPVTETPGQSASSRLMGRFNLLRKSPMKSILRMPQRLYSEDPAKVAAGTHLATPPGKKAAELNKALPAAPHAAGHASKKVDFSSSTKARDQRSQECSSSDSKTSTPSPKTERTASMGPMPEPESQPELADPWVPLEVPTYDRMPSLSPSPQKRRQTVGPRDFTFRVDRNGITFARSPNAPASEAQNHHPSTIRHVSADVMPSPASATASKERLFAAPNATARIAPSTKKRKFEFENQMAAAKADASAGVDEATSDKENTPALPDEADALGPRPAKRVKACAPSPTPLTTTWSSAATAPTAASAARRTTLGVKPKPPASPVKKNMRNHHTAPDPARRPSTATTISQSRLAALARPKKRE